MLNYTMPAPPAAGGQVGQTGAMPPMTMQLPPPPAGAPMGPQNPNAVMPPTPQANNTGYWDNPAGGAGGPWRGVAMPGMPSTASGRGMPGPPSMGEAPGAYNIGNGAQFGGQSTVNPQANPADYGSVRGFADQAYDQSMRYLQPQMESQNRRFDQQLINQGLDPSSEAGRLAADQLARGQNDLQSKAAFDALTFGQGLQQQMYGQDLERSRLATQNQANRWGALGDRFGTQAGIYGNQLGFGSNIFGAQAGMYNNQASNNAAMHNAQLGFNADMGRLDVLRQQQDWNQNMDMEKLNQWQAGFNRDNDRWKTDLGMKLAGFGDMPNYTMGQPGTPTQDPAAWAGDLGTNMWNWGQGQNPWGGG